MLVVLSVLAALTVGVVTLLIAGPLPAVLIALLLLIAGVIAQRSEGPLRRGLGITMLVALLGIGAYGSLLTFELLEALQGTDGPVDPGDETALASAEAKLGDLAVTSAFRLELTESELQAVVQDGLADAGEVPVRRIELDLRGTTQDLAFTATFKTGDVSARGTATVVAAAGGIDLTLSKLDFGPIRVPSLAAGAIQTLLSAVTDLNAALADQRASVQSVTITEDLLIVTGTRAGADVLTSADLLSAITAQASIAVSAVQAPPERIGRGLEASSDAPGTPMVLAVGDSLAAGVGVDDPRDGFVSRLHGHLLGSDGTAYGLVNLAIPGETSGSLLSGGQLAAAEARLATTPAAYVVIDIGANDMLGHLTSPDCSADLAGAGCQALVEQTLTAYRANLAQVLDRLTAASGQARVVLLTVYNPFSLGLGDSPEERQSSAILARLNSVATEVAGPRGVTVADGFTPMLGTAAATTHMLDAEPDIHPNAAGHDVLAAAIVDAL